MARQLRILVGSCGSTAAQNLAWAVRQAGDDDFVAGTDCELPNGGRGLFEAEQRVPHGDDPAYMESIANAAHELGVHLFIPVMGPELAAASRHRNLLAERGIDTLVSPLSTIQVCLSKRSLTLCFQELDIPHPALLQPGGIQEDAFARPDMGSGSKGAGAVAAADLANAMTTRPDTVFTECLSGTEHSVDCYADGSGRLIHAIARTRDEVRGGLVVRSRVVPLDRSVRKHVERICTALELEGFFNAQYFLLDSGEVRFFDLNPRLGGGMALSFMAGLEPVRYLRARLSGEVLPAGGAERVGMQLFRRWHNVIVEPAQTE